MTVPFPLCSLESRAALPAHPSAPGHQVLARSWEWGARARKGRAEESRPLMPSEAPVCKRRLHLVWGMMRTQHKRPGLPRASDGHVGRPPASGPLTPATSALTSTRLSPVCVGTWPACRPPLRFHCPYVTGWWAVSRTPRCEHCSLPSLANWHSVGFGFSRRQLLCFSPFAQGSFSFLVFIL